MRDSSATEKVFFGFAAAIFIVSIWPRFIDIEKFLPYYSIDENDIVEWTVGFLGGDLDPRWFGYGSLYPYLLAVIYKIQSFFYHGSFEEFVQQVFFEPKNFYYTARFFNSTLSVGLIWLTYLTAKKFFSGKLALIALMLACFPFFEILVQFTARIDTLLAVSGVSAVYFALRFHQSGKTIHYILAGLMVGLGIATKALPGLLVLPTMAIAHFFRVKAKLEENGKKAGIMALITSFLYDRNIYILAGMVFAGNFIGNPYSVLNFDAFWNEQVATIGSERIRNFIPGYDITRFARFYGYPFVVITCIAFIHSLIRHRTGKHIILMSYALIYWLAFAKGSAREYWYVPIVPILILVISQLILDISEKVKNYKMLGTAVPLLIVLVIIFQPAKEVYSAHRKMNAKSDYSELHTAMAAYEWAIKNIPDGSKIMMHGLFTDLPHLVDYNRARQAEWAEYFPSGRRKNLFLVKQFENAHDNRMRSNIPMYNLVRNITSRDITSKKLTIMRFKLGVKKNHFPIFLEILPDTECDYIIASDYQGKRDIATFRLSDSSYFKKLIVKKFTNTEYPFGNEITIYKLK